MTPRFVLAGSCPGCGAPFGFVVGPNGEPAGIAHVLPMCAEFRARDATGFLAWVNDVREAERRPAAEA